MSKHTPGPWEAVEVGSFGHENPIAVCEVQTADGYTTVCEHAWEDDARLIAAAPELLYALCRMVDLYENGATKHGFVRDAIAKATGE